MASEHFKLAVLNVLAASAEGRATLDELRRDVPIILANEDETEQLRRFSALGDVDIFQSGLLLRNDTGFEITGAGLSLLQSLESGAAPVAVSSIPSSPALKLIDELIGSEERLKIFDLELRTFEDSLDECIEHPPEEEEKGGSANPGAPQVTPDATGLSLAEDIDTPVTAEAEEQRFEDQTAAVDSNAAPSYDAPSFLRRGFGYKPEKRNIESSRGFFASKIKSIPHLWRRHVAQDVARPKTERASERMSGVAFLFLTVLALVACVGAVFAFAQINSLKSEIALLHRELLPLKERIAKFEQTERRRESDQQEAQNKSERDKAREAQPALNLSREEIQLVREFIKPAPFAGMTGATLNVGDPVGNETIPLPSSITDKVPKLLGARFTIRNGSIVIVKRGGQQADAVLGPN